MRLLVTATFVAGTVASAWGPSVSAARAALPSGCVGDAITVTCTFTANGSFTVPSLVTSVQLEAVGGNGAAGQDGSAPGGGGGAGADLVTTIPVGGSSLVQPSEVLTVIVGGNATGSTGGAHGGGNASVAASTLTPRIGGGGGGSTELDGTPGPHERLVVAAGGGGGGAGDYWEHFSPTTIVGLAGGAGGSASAGDGVDGAGANGIGGGGAGASASEVGGSGGTVSASDIGFAGTDGMDGGADGQGGVSGSGGVDDLNAAAGGGGGGGGYLGGGGGGGGASGTDSASDIMYAAGGGGGAGTSFTDGWDYTLTNGDGSPRMVISYDRQPNSVTFTSPPPAHAVVGGRFNVSATGDTDSPVTFASTSNTICTVAGSTVTFRAGGRCEVTASQDGTDSYAPASAQQIFTVYKLTEHPTLTVQSPKRGRLRVRVAAVPAMNGLVVKVYRRVNHSDQKIGTTHTNRSGVARFAHRERPGSMLRIQVTLAGSATTYAAKSGLKKVRIKGGRRPHKS